MRSLRALAVALAAALIGPLLVTAPATGLAPSLTATAGWTTARFSAYYGRATTGGEAYSTPAVGDIDGDGQADLVAGFADGNIYAWHTDGQLFLRHWTGGGSIQASPLLADIDGNGIVDVVAANTNGDIVVTNGFGQRLFQARDVCPGRTCGFFGTPAVADLDRDGRPEIIAGGWGERIIAWRVDGSIMPGFPVQVYDSVWSSTSVADIDGDGYPEIVVGGDSDDGSYVFGGRGGVLWVIRHDGSRQPGFPKFIAGQTMWSSPAVADLNQDGNLDIVVGTGHFFPAPAGQFVNAFDRWGNQLPGWPVAVSARTMSSPAIGDITGDGRPEVVTMSDDGKVWAIAANGSILPGWPRCAGTNPCPLPLHGSAGIADVDNDGRQEVVVGSEQWVRVLGADGAQKYGAPTRSGIQPITGVPSVANVNGKSWIVASAGLDTDGDNFPDTGSIWAFTTGANYAPSDWPTFQQNFKRSGSVIDTTPPAPTLSVPAGTQSTTRVPVSWSATDGGTGVLSFDVDVRRNGGPWTSWMNGRPPVSRSGATASGSLGLYGSRGDVYLVRMRARDRGGNVSDWTAAQTATIGSGATSAVPFGSAYSPAGDGTVSSISSPVVQGPSFGFNITRGVAAVPGGGGYVVDGFGGVHPFGSASPIATSAYWYGWDIVRGIAVAGDGSGYVLDGYGGIHPVGGAKAIPPGGYWNGWDIARGIALLPTSTKTNPAGYVLDGFGGVHAFGSAPPVAPTGYWSGWDIARGLTLNSDGSGYVLDGFGGLHPFGGAVALRGSGYWNGWDITRGVSALPGSTNSAPAGYVVDGYGGVHPYGSAPIPEVSRLWSTPSARGIAVAS